MAATTQQLMTDIVSEPHEEAPCYTQLEAQRFARGTLREARGGLAAGTEVFLAYRRSVLTLPKICGGVLRHEYLCSFVYGPGRVMNFLARDEELVSFKDKDGKPLGADEHDQH